MKSSKKTRFVIYLMMIATTITMMNGRIETAPTFVKYMFAFSLWASLIYFPYSYISNNDFGKVANYSIKLMIALAMFAVLKSLLTPPDIIIGNMYVTLFGNEQCMFFLLAPCCIFLSQSEFSLSYLKKSLFVFLLLGTVFLMFGNLYIGLIIWVSTVFLPYVDVKYRLLILLSIFAAFVTAAFGENTARTHFLIILFAGISYVLVYLVGNIRLIKIFCFSIIGITVLYSTLTLIFPDLSMIQTVLNYIVDQTKDETLGADTRTFLYQEMANDLTENHAWVLGKGAYSHYYSLFFETSGEGDFYYRLTSEVTLLALLLRGGAAFVLLYYMLLGYSIYKSLTQSNSKFLLSLAIMITGWFFVSSISYCNGFNYRHVGIFLFVGMCLSKRWLRCTEYDIKKIIG